MAVSFFWVPKACAVRMVEMTSSAKDPPSAILVRDSLTEIVKTIARGR
jgi:hypothetical protein